MQITLFASPSISFRQMRDGPTLPPSIPGFDAYHVQTKSMEGDQSKVVFVLPILRGVLLLRIIVWGNYSFSFTHSNNPTPTFSPLPKAVHTEQDNENLVFFLLRISFTLASTNCTGMHSLRVQTTSLIRCWTPHFCEGMYCMHVLDLYFIQGQSYCLPNSTTVYRFIVNRISVYYNGSIFVEEGLGHMPVSASLVLWLPVQVPCIQCLTVHLMRPQCLPVHL